MRTAAFSIISPNYRSLARLLAGSLEQHHPEWDRFVLLVGRENPGSDHEPFTTIPLEALSLPHLPAFTFRYTILELNTAVKPWMFEHLFAKGYDRVLYLDPDLYFYSRLIELDAASPDTFLTLTPHLTGSIENEHHPSELTILQAGAYNLGFLSVVRQPALPRFLQWWQSRLERHCVVEPERGLFVDQKWLDLAPGMFSGVEILRHDGYNVAYWNLRQRTVRNGPDGVTVNGVPLRFFHFSGVDPSTPELLSRHDRLTLEEIGHARVLVEEYRSALLEAGYESERKAPYDFGSFADGTPISGAARFAYRNSPELQSASGDDPFARPELFRDIRQRGRAPLVATLMLQSYRLLSRARPLVGLLPHPVRTSLREFLLGRKERRPKASVRPSALAGGINVVGYLSRETGVGESARLSRRACNAAGLPTQAIDIDKFEGESPLPHRATIFHINADQTLAVLENRPQLFASGAFNIGCWHWELPELPDGWIASAGPLDEIWAPSAFIQATLSRKLSIPVVHMPHGVAVSELEPCTPQELGVPSGRVTFLCMFDIESVVARKNPLGAAEAFRRAFAPEEPVALLIKVSHAGAHPEKLRELAESLHGFPNVYLTDRMLTRTRVNGLLSACDAVVSLHRAEGFGLILAEAMDLGKPVVATGWSGNMDFMTPSNSCPVGFELVPLERSYGSYEAGQLWAEPDLDHAAQQMRRLVEEPRWREDVGQRAQATIRSNFSPAAAGQRYRQRLNILGLLDPARRR